MSDILEEIVFCCVIGDSPSLELYLQDGLVDPSADNNVAIQAAFFYGHNDIVDLLLQDERISKDIKNKSDLVNLILEDDRTPEDVKQKIVGEL